MNKIRKKRICIDINSITQFFKTGYLSGIGRTTLELLEAISDLQQEEELPFQFILYSQNLKGIKGKKFGFPFENKHIYLRNKSPYNEWLAKFNLKEYLFSYDIYHIPHNFCYVSCPEKTVVTIHDTLFFAYPESFLGHNFARENYPKLAQACKGIVTCSESSKQDIIKYMNIPDEKVTVIHWGVSSKNFFPESESQIHLIRKQFSLSRNYYMMSSCDIGRKNTELLMENFRNYIEAGGKYDLVLIWKNCPQNIQEKYRKEIETKRIHFYGGISDNELRSLYSGAIATFFPSKYEGFGLPVLESMACGTPVVTCKNSSLKEVGGNVAFYVSENSPTDMAQFMHDFESGKYDFNELKNSALSHIKNFSWQKAAENYLEFYLKHL